MEPLMKRCSFHVATTIFVYMQWLWICVLIMVGTLRSNYSATANRSIGSWSSHVHFWNRKGEIHCCLVDQKRLHHLLLESFCMLCRDGAPKCAGKYALVPNRLEFGKPVCKHSDQDCFLKEVTARQRRRPCFICSPRGDWGEGRIDQEASLRLQTIPYSFVCPISFGIMANPVATMDRVVYDRDHIEEWFQAWHNGAHRSTISDSRISRIHIAL